MSVVWPAILVWGVALAGGILWWRPRRLKLIDIAAAMSLLLSVTAAMLAVRTFWTQDLVSVEYRWRPSEYGSNCRSLEFSSDNGMLTFGCRRDDILDYRLYAKDFEGGWAASARVDRDMRPSGISTIYQHLSRGSFERYATRNIGFAGFGGGHLAGPVTAAQHYEDWFVFVPAWFLFLAFAILPIWRFRHLHRARRRSARAA